MASVYMLPSNMNPSNINLHIAKIQGYNNNILAAPSTVNPGSQVDMNTPKSVAKAPPTKLGGKVENALVRLSSMW